MDEQSVLIIRCDTSGRSTIPNFCATDRWEIVSPDDAIDVAMDVLEEGLKRPDMSQETRDDVRNEFRRSGQVVISDGDIIDDNDWRSPSPDEWQVLMLQLWKPES